MLILKLFSKKLTQSRKKIGKLFHSRIFQCWSPEQPTGGIELGVADAAMCGQDPPSGLPPDLQLPPSPQSQVPVNGQCGPLQRQIEIMAGPESGAQYQFTAIQNYFNSYTLTGRRNCVLATYGSIALIVLYFKLRSKKTPAVKAT